ncbi:unnamed protein product [Adineta ricciae]|uniref:MULE transposase domain-containing protein n=1 Tax=Adineta ricciae TaxID=249248 RepID=A0A814BF81_ADIRI|nr:unnamed protein product [Adineta ricciae]CAF1340608.1 unnamed protein product [Adineta ricciae]
MSKISENGTTKRKPRLDLDGHSYIQDRPYVRVFSQQVAERALNTQETPEAIITNCYKSMSDSSIARLPVRENIKRRIRILRQNNQLVKEPNDPKFLSVPNELTLTHRKERFLCSDTGPGHDRILIFASPEQLQILQSSEEFLVDGTFKVVPEIFYELFIIHAVYRNYAVPVIYALLRRKNTDTYQRLIDEILKIAPNWSSRLIMMDFEQASINPFQTKFPIIHLSGCYFHLRQTLAFLESTSVVDGFELLCEELGEGYDDILDYFESTYIGELRSNRIRQKPLFDISFWSMHNRTTHSSMRTNNCADAYHRRINSTFQCAHPTLWLFVQKLFDEENVVHADLVHIIAGEPPKKKKITERLERRLLNLLTTNHSPIAVQLNSIAYSISLKKINFSF